MQSSWLHSGDKDIVFLILQTETLKESSQHLRGAQPLLAGPSSHEP